MIMSKLFVYCSKSFYLARIYFNITTHQLVTMQFSQIYNLKIFFNHYQHERTQISSLKLSVRVHYGHFHTAITTSSQKVNETGVYRRLPMKGVILQREIKTLCTGTSHCVTGISISSFFFFSSIDGPSLIFQRKRIVTILLSWHL